MPPPELLLDVPPAPVELEDDPPLAPVPLLAPVPPLFVSVELLLAGPALDELELPLGGAAPVLGGVVTVVSSFLLQAAADSATATPIAIHSCLLITRSSLRLSVFR